MRTAPWAFDILCGDRGHDPPCSLSPAPSVCDGLPTPHSRIGLFLPAALLPNGSLLRRLRDATEPLVVTNTQLPTSTAAPQVEEAAAVEVQLGVQVHQVSGHQCLLLGGRMLDGWYPSSPR